MLQAKEIYLSAEEYFDLEEYAEYKSEYYHGEIFAMSGASHSHNIIAVNISAGLHSALYDRDCFVYGGDMKVQIDPAMHYTYPDVSVVCGDVEFFKDRKDIICNPLVIFEILSESTADYDRGSKFRAYRQISSLRDYILADQYSCFVEHYSKNESGLWTLRDHDSLSDSFRIPSLEMELSLKDIYHRIRFEDQ